MIRNIFLPEHVGTYYLFPKRIVGFDIGKTHIHATQIYLKGRQVTIEKCIEVALENGSVSMYNERVAAALVTIAQQLDRYDAIHTSLSSSLVIFKELTIPFIGRDKVAMVADFEVEPLLPFALADAVIDCIITQENKTEKTSKVLVAATQKVHVDEHLQLFQEAGLTVQQIIVDLFVLYGTYLQIPSYSKLEGGVALIDIGSYTTTIGYIHNGQLRLIRSLPKGVATIAKSISDELDVSASEALESIMRYGLERYDNPAYTKTMNNALTSFWQEIAFTLNSFTALDQAPLTRIVLLGGGADIKGLPAFVTTQAQTPCELMRINELLHTATISIVGKNNIPFRSILSLSSALPSPVIQNFNLQPKIVTKASDASLLNKQLICAAILSLMMLISFGVFSFLQLHTLNTAVDEYQQEAVEALKHQFPKALSDVGNLEDAVEQSTLQVKREEELWFSFANPMRPSFLTYLLELTSKIDKRDLGFTIDKLTITEPAITLTAHVKDHAALALLEKELRQSKLFAHVEGQQNPDFTMKIKLAKPV
ncbi:MAG: pilus assembly protein PilM [Candidatus Babeliales bacterium]